MHILFGFFNKFIFFRGTRFDFIYLEVYFVVRVLHVWVYQTNVTQIIVQMKNR